MESLTAREREVLRLVATGLSTKRLAGALGITFKTAACHRYRVMNKLGVSNTAEMVVFAVRSGLVDLFSTPDEASANGYHNVSADRVALALEESRRQREHLHEALAQFKMLWEQLQTTQTEFAAVNSAFCRRFERLKATSKNGHHGSTTSA